ncbi:MAG: VOC family protein [Pedobacter sp.]|nr:MAG: VOC family protein [Pedobacter sp.]
MSNTSKLKHEQIQYVELLTLDIASTKSFYTQCFNWEFTDYGSEYTAFEGENVDGGFTVGKPVNGSILVILYSDNLEVTKEKVIQAGGNIVKDIFSFPGGRRFHFTDNNGYELAVWAY